METCSDTVSQDEYLEKSDMEPLIEPLAGETSRNHGGSEKFVYMASMMAAIGGITFGYDMGIISGAMLQLTNDLDLSPHQQEVIVSAMLIGGLVGSLLGGFFLDWFGRRSTIIGNTALFFIGALVMSLAESYHTLVLGRLIAGVAMAVSGTGECVYVSEISPPDKRGSLVLLNETGICLGILVAYFVSFVFISTEGGWRYMFLLSAVPAIVQAVGMYLLPASPRFLLMTGKDTEAHDTLSRLRGTPDIQEEWEELRCALHLDQNRTQQCLVLCSSRRNLRGRMLIALGLVVFENLTGQTAVIYYAPTIFQMLGFSSDFTATLATMGLGFTKLFASVIALFTVDVAGRRRLLLIGGGLMTVVITVLGAVVKAPANSIAANGTSTINTPPVASPHQNLYTSSTQRTYAPYKVKNITGPELAQRRRRDVKSYHSAPEESYYFRRTLSRNSRSSDDLNGVSPKTSFFVKMVAVISLMLYVFAFSLGYGPVVWLLLSELFPADVRGRAASLATATNFMVNILINLTFLDVVASVGVSTTFLMFAVICLLGVLYIYCLIPETKGYSLEEISQQLSQRAFPLTRNNRTCCLGNGSDGHVA